jgi:hypothetical protein
MMDSRSRTRRRKRRSCGRGSRAPPRGCPARRHSLSTGPRAATRTTRAAARAAALTGPVSQPDLPRRWRGEPSRDSQPRRRREGDRASIPRACADDGPSPIVTPGQTMTPPPSQTLSPSVIGLPVSQPCRRGSGSTGCVAARGCTCVASWQAAPIPTQANPDTYSYGVASTGERTVAAALCECGNASCATCRKGWPQTGCRNDPPLHRPLISRARAQESMPAAKRCERRGLRTIL